VFEVSFPFGLAPKGIGYGFVSTSFQLIEDVTYKP